MSFLNFGCSPSPTDTFWSLFDNTEIENLQLFLVVLSSPCLLPGWVFLAVKNVHYPWCGWSAKVNSNFLKVNSTFHLIFFLRILRALLNKFLWGCDFHGYLQPNVQFSHWRKAQINLAKWGLTYSTGKKTNSFFVCLLSPESHSIIIRLLCNCLRFAQF